MLKCSYVSTSPHGVTYSLEDSLDGIHYCQVSTVAFRSYGGLAQRRHWDGRVVLEDILLLPLVFLFRRHQQQKSTAVVDVGSQQQVRPAAWIQLINEMQAAKTKEQLRLI